MTAPCAGPACPANATVRCEACTKAYCARCYSGGSSTKCALCWRRHAQGASQ